MAALPNALPNYWQTAKSLGRVAFRLPALGLPAAASSPRKISYLHTSTGAKRFGTRGALGIGIMTTAIENLELEGAYAPTPTRTEAAELLESLRAAYQALSWQERCYIKARITSLSRTQSRIRTI
jgi:hypothetical protein